MIQFNRIQLTSQTPNHVEIIRILNTTQCESRIIDSYWQSMEVWRMYYVLKVYWLSCSNYCAESSSPFEHTKNWFLKSRVDTNLCQVLIDVKYTRDWQLGLKKNLQDSVVKPIILTTQNLKFSVTLRSWIDGRVLINGKGGGRKNS